MTRTRSRARPERRPDFLFEGELFAAGKPLFQCDGKLWLPRNAREMGAIDLGNVSLPEPGFLALMNEGETVELRARAQGRDTEIAATGVWADAWPLQFASAERVRRMEIRVEDIDLLKVTEKFGVTSPDSESSEEHVQVRLTDTDYLMLGGIQEFHPSGEIRVRPSKPVEFAHPTIGTLRFERHHVHDQIEHGDYLLTSEVRITLSSNAQGRSLDIEQQASMDDIDDLLLLLSFAARHRVLANGWVRTRSGTIERAFVSCLRPQVVEKGQRAYQPLIERHNAMEFLAEAGRAFVGLPLVVREAVRQTLYPLVPVSIQVLEQSLLAMFSVFERLASLLSNTRPTLDTSTWKTVEAAVMKTINAIELPNAQVKAMLLAKIPELRRPPARDHILGFIEHYAVQTHDLWPLFGPRRDGVSLFGLRNSLAHGRPFPSSAFPALCGAQLHLHTLLERSVLRVLGWDKSNGADPASMKAAGYVDFPDPDRMRRTLIEA